MPQQGLRGSFDNPLVRVKTPEGFEERSITISRLMDIGWLFETDSIWGTR
ncbi:MAG: hypothetical protein CM1200mP35_05240 [Chloroflexota bacterium]|nr:MAG: hypothetical protein CM1200mP35_05240 [Chloroflexota bacterium]